eukprot:gb/GECG01009883.1/.p1 GENE.gb/GECG01009883.1/~~gb/GECG01009883.1/.p1  ORF type:complete len:193 (+),score=30.51 gb/GECG01009883.1/:1-579(+)
MSATGTAGVARRGEEEKEYFMREALGEAELAFEEGEVPVGCVIVSRKGDSGPRTILTRGHNKTVESRNPTQHAEIVSLNRFFREHPNSALETLRDTEIFVTVEPCIMCTSALLKVGIKKAFFGAYNDKFGGCGSVLDVKKEGERQLEIEGELFKDEAISLLRRFYDKPNELAPNPRRKQDRTCTREKEDSVT